VYQAAADVTPLRYFALADHDNVHRHKQVTQRMPEPDRLLGGVLNLGLHDEKVEVAVTPVMSSRARAEQDDLSRWHAAPSWDPCRFEAIAQAS